MIYLVVSGLVLSIVFNFFNLRIIGRQIIALEKKDIELLALKIQLDLERVKHSEKEATQISERMVQ